MKNNTSKDLNLSSNERLFLENTSVFKPKNYKNLNPRGFKIYTFHAGFKKKLDDLLIIIFEETAEVAKVYSKTSTPSSPIIWDKKFNKGKVKALIVNSGNANAHTGKKGLNIISEYVQFLSTELKCKKGEILVSSTGVIGELFDPKLIINQIKKIKEDNNTTLLQGAKSIMTTDTYPKISLKNIKINKTPIRLYGIAKGSGMIHPNMGTLLVYIFIETKISSGLLNKLLLNNLDNTFNSITVDSDTSTSDTLFLFSVGNKKINLNNKKNISIINTALLDIMQDLSLQIIKDGEGLTKLIQVNVLKARTKNQARNIAFSIANSPLVKTAVTGEDANWGRIIMAIGKSQEKINQNKIEIYFGENLVCKEGSINTNINNAKLNNYMKKNTICINVFLNIGEKNHTVFGNDLSNEYIRINSDYRS